ncbi:MAG: DUF6340 family protein [Ginsengibacter sp.]
MKNIYAGIAILFILSSCASTELLRMSVLEPAPVTLPATIKNVVVVNRTLVSAKSKVYDAIDKAVTLEGAELDKEGAEQAVIGLTDELKKNNRFDEVEILLGAGLTTDAPGIFSAPLSWDLVEKYGNDHNADALFCLEFFDTDSKVDYSVNKSDVKTPLGNVPVIEQQADMHTIVKTGWRIYDIKDHEILDESSVLKNITYSGRGINPMLAAQALIDRKEAVKQVGKASGHTYALRIVPLWVRVPRDYYVRGSNNFKMAKRMALTGNWDGAAKLWQQETANTKRKVAGRACYNMAIISEINGDINTAIQWAQKSYENYNNRLALSYVNILKNRQVSDVVAANQESL